MTDERAGMTATETAVVDDRSPEPESADDVAGADTPATTDPRGAGWRSWLPWAVTAVAIAVAVFATVQWRDLADREAAREDVAAAGAGFLTTLTTWDATDGLDDTREALTAVGTEGFRSEVDELFGGDLGTALEEVGARSRGEVRDLFVQRIEGDEALVFAVVTQTIESGEEAPTTTVRGARLLLQRAGDGWLVHEVELVEDGLVTGASSP